MSGNAQQGKASDPKASAWVNANAGSGKTHVLINRLIRLMLDGTEPSKILCLTFTRAAASEMASRLYDRVGGWITLGDEDLQGKLRELGAEDVSPERLRRARQLFTAALETPGGLKIQTIHAFCERLLQLFPVEAGIVPDFTVMDDRASAEALSAARRHVLQGIQRDPQSAISTAFAEVVRHAQAEQFDELLTAILRQRADLADILENTGGVAEASSLLRTALDLQPGEDEAAVHATLSLDRPLCQRFIAALNTGSDAAKAVASQIAGVLLRANATLFDLQDVYLTGEKKPRSLRTMASAQILAAWPDAAGFATAEQARLATALGKLADLEHLRATLALLTVASAITLAFEREKRRGGAYDFDDLILRTSGLLAAQPDAAWVLFKLDGGIDHVLVDEAQDTSPAQWNIIRALTEEFFSGIGVERPKPRTLFVVGDRKQSIYSFQGADPDVFEEVFAGFGERIRAAGENFYPLDFTVSYRSLPAVLQAVDAVFAPGRLARQGLEGPMPRDFLHQAQRVGQRGLVELWPLVEPEDRGEDQPWQAPVDQEPANSPARRLARAVAARVKSWIGHRQLLAAGRAVTASDILILVRVRNAFFDALIRELRLAGIPVAGADRLKLGENLAVLDLMALARFCLMPGDDYALACLLKSPLAPRPLSEAQIFDLAAERGGQSLWQRLQDSADNDCQLIAARLMRWRGLAHSLRPFEFFGAVLTETRAAIYARLGSEARDALDAFLDATLAHERDHGASLQGFVQWFTSGDVEIKRNMEQGADEVRIMTVHGAKGLEAPIVILPDTVSMPDHKTASPLMMLETDNGGQDLPFWRLPGRYVSQALTRHKLAGEEDRAHEYRRLLYVAMTRARDELYVCGYRGQHEASDKCWYSMVEDALQPLMREAGDGVRRMGDDPVLAAAKPVAATQVTELPAWLNTPPPPEPETEAHATPSSLGKSGAVNRPAVARGLIIHRVLQLLPDVKAENWPAFIRRTLIKSGLDENDAVQLSDLVQREDVRAILAPGGMSEVPIRVKIAALDQPISGRLDRLLFRDGEVLAFDYKTDRAPPARPDAVSPAYRLQMAAYREALQAIHPGQAVRCFILWTETLGLMELPGSVLADALLHIPGNRP
ncbi:double-strand break repair helicase AddA [Aestuariivirga sp.]|uniref:double-strand break repair helicase AddA n=1 Tax=Aestuariivirga sp. TaxID=2650926 RepID=UPI0039E4F564